MIYAIKNRKSGEYWTGSYKAGKDGWSDIEGAKFYGKVGHAKCAVTSEKLVNVDIEKYQIVFADKFPYPN